MASALPGAVKTIYFTPSSDGKMPNFMFPLEKDQKPFQCGFCKTAFDSPLELSVHVQNHLLTGPYQCGYCPLNYNTISELKEHVKTHKLFIRYSAALPSATEQTPLSDSPTGEHDRSKQYTCDCETLSHASNCRNCALSSDQLMLTEEIKAIAQNSYQAFNAELETDSDRYLKTAVKNEAVDEAVSDTGRKTAQTGSVPDSPLMMSVEEVIEHDDDDDSASVRSPDSSVPSEFKTETAFDPTLPSIHSNSQNIAEANSATSSTTDTAKSYEEMMPLNSATHTCGSETAQKVKVHDAAANKDTFINPKQQETSLDAETHSSANIVVPKAEIPTGEDSVKQEDYFLICVLCRGAFASAKQLSEHWRLAHKTCELCGACILEPCKLHTHLKVVHGQDNGLDRPYLCGVCGARFMNTRRATEHIRRIHKKKNKQGNEQCVNVHRCLHCEQSFRYNSDLIKHSMSEHGDGKVLPCPHCPSRFKGTTQLNIHVFCVHKGERPHECPICQKRFKVKYEVKRHMFRVHWDKTARDSDKTEVLASGESKVSESHKSPICGKPFQSSHKLSEHVTAHEQHASVYRCLHCEQIFRVAADLVQHSTLEHGDDKAFPCPHCPSRFKSKRHMSAHVFCVHENVRPHKCPVCQKSFKVKYDVKRHIFRVHLGNKAQDSDKSEVLALVEGKVCESHMCHICGKCFIGSSSLSKHIKTVHSAESERDKDHKPFKCTLCGRAFRWKNLFQMHQTVHSKEKQYTCDICGKSFARKLTLMYHKHSHTNSRIFKCKVCNKGFNSHSAVFAHKRHHHEGYRPFVCDVCGKRFYYAGNMKRHALTHTDLRPVSCSYCGKTYRSKSSLRYHLTRVHGDGKKQSVVSPDPRPQ